MGEEPSEVGEEVNLRERVAPVISNPLGMAIGAAAIGFLIGLMIPVTRVEEQTLPKVRDKFGEQIKAVDLMERAGRVLDEAKRAATHAVQEEARQASEALSARNQQET